MGKSNRHATNERSSIQCIEVLIAKSYLTNNSSNLLWTLSVYSLENQPAKKDRALHSSEIFHFMVYDWKRTIKGLLHERQVPYSIIQFFTPDTIYFDHSKAGVETPDNEVAFLSAFERLPDASVVPDHVLEAPRDLTENADLFH